MCGIAGLLSSDVNGHGLVSQMLDLQAHRGPDGAGIWSKRVDEARTLHLGHRRLAIIDLTTAASQPMEDGSGQFVLTYNGEIYNYLEVRAELIALGANFRTQSDTEVILEAYKRWGAACLERLNGMFAFALYDRPAGKLFCARDRFGEKPFLFTLTREFFAFSSEYKALLSHPGVLLDVDEMRLIRAAHHPGTGLDADRQTVFSSVQQLLPGEAMEVDVHTLGSRIWRYWQIEPAALDERGRDADIFEEFRGLLIDAVRLRLRSDVTVGSCLSGGLDSSAIVCIVRKLIGNTAPYHTFTGRFPGSSADEWRYASEVISQTGVISHTVEPTVERFLDDLPDFIWHNELPVGSSSQFAQWCVFRLAKEEGVTVLLDGQGADEMLGGYEQYFAFYIQALRERKEFGRIKEELPLIRQRYPLALAGRRRLVRDSLPFRLRHWLSNHLNVGTSILYGLKVDVAEKIVRSNALPRQPSLHALASVLEADTFGRTLTTLLRYGDRNSMAHSREVRLPFCDHRIAEFVFRLPPHLIMGEVQTKRLLRESMRGILPESIRTRWNKQGFLPPQDLWFKSARMQAAVRDVLGDARFLERGPWLKEWCEAGLARVERGHLGLGWTLWHPFMIQLWRQHFLQRIINQRAKAASSLCVA